jgi:dihydroorotate dehydrogenase electron transfer subunit
MRAHKNEGWLEFLYKPVGAGLVKLAQRKAGERLSILAPIGNGFTPHPDRRTVLALGGGVGIPPMIFLAEHLKEDPRWRTIVFAASEVPFPFKLTSNPSALLGVPAQATAGLELLEQWGVPSRLASRAALSGCFPGLITDLARAWLTAQKPEALAQTQLLGCGPMPMLRAVADLAHSFALPCQVAVEEYMACGVGGCAGCTIPIATADGPAMRRVCVDGPVFGADELFPPRK